MDFDDLGTLSEPVPASTGLGTFASESQQIHTVPTGVATTKGSSTSHTGKLLMPPVLSPLELPPSITDPIPRPGGGCLQSPDPADRSRMKRSGPVVVVAPPRPDRSSSAGARRSRGGGYRNHIRRANTPTSGPRSFSPQSKSPFSGSFGSQTALPQGSMSGNPLGHHLYELPPALAPRPGGSINTTDHHQHTSTRRAVMATNLLTQARKPPNLIPVRKADINKLNDLVANPSNTAGGRPTSHGKTKMIPTVPFQDVKGTMRWNPYSKVNTMWCGLAYFFFLAILVGIYSGMVFLVGQLAGHNLKDAGWYKLPP